MIEHFKDDEEENVIDKFCKIQRVRNNIRRVGIENNYQTEFEITFVPRDRETQLCRIAFENVYDRFFSLLGNYVDLSSSEIVNEWIGSNRVEEFDGLADYKFSMVGCTKTLESNKVTTSSFCIALRM